MENLDIRVRVYDSGITYRQIAKKIGLTPEHLSHVMRFPLKKSDRKRITDAINELEEMKNG